MYGSVTINPPATIAFQNRDFDTPLIRFSWHPFLSFTPCSFQLVNTAQQVDNNGQCGGIVRVYHADLRARRH